jgi:hypothetical protein
MIEEAATTVISQKSVNQTDQTKNNTKEPTAVESPS